MRIVFGIISLLLALLIVNLLLKQQLGAVSAKPAMSGSSSHLSVTVPTITPGNAKEQSEQIQQQVRQAIEAAQQAKPMPDEAK